jgi:hypothetical protein
MFMSAGCQWCSNCTKGANNQSISTHQLVLYLHRGPQVLIRYVVLCQPKPHEEVVPILLSTQIFCIWSWCPASSKVAKEIMMLGYTGSCWRTEFCWSSCCHAHSGYGISCCHLFCMLRDWSFCYTKCMCDIDLSCENKSWLWVSNVTIKILFCHSLYSIYLDLIVVMIGRATRAICSSDVKSVTKMMANLWP